MPPRAENEILARGERQRALAPDVWLLDGPPGEEGARNADYTQDDLLLSKDVRSDGVNGDERRGDERYGRS